MKYLLILFLLISSALIAEEPRHKQIQYGPFVTATIDSEWPRGNISYKGLAVRLTENGKDVGGILYDTDLVRVASAWTGGFLNFTKDVMRARDYRSILPVSEPIVATGQLPGWGKPSNGSFEDPRERPFGPLPREWSKYRGIYLSGDKSVVFYTSGQSEILELPQAERVGDQLFITRTLDIKKINQKLLSLILNRPGTVGTLLENGSIAFLEPEVKDKNAKAGKVSVVMDHTPSNGNWLSMGFASRSDYGNRKKGVVVSFDPKLSEVTAESDAKENTLSRLQDGNGGQHDMDIGRVVSFKSDSAVIYYDLAKSTDVKMIETFSWHRKEKSYQKYTVFGSNDAQRPVADSDKWQEIAKVDTTTLDEGGIHGVSIARENGSIGKYKFLMFKVEKAKGNPTWFTEIDVHSAKDKPKFKKMNPETVYAVALVNSGAGEKLVIKDKSHIQLSVDASAEKRLVKLALWSGPKSKIKEFTDAVKKMSPAESLDKYTKGGAARWTETVKTKGIVSTKKSAYVVDEISLPMNNPYKSWFRLGGFDFFKDSTKAAVSNWNGDVWTVTGIDKDLNELTWKRIATGLFHPLGLDIVNDSIYVVGRDQITKLVDLNEDGETDFYENFNNDVEVTWNFHEFTFDLQSDEAGNFYYSKGAPVRNGGRGFDYVAKHNGTVVKVSPDGKSSKVFATGLRAPNGISVRKDGQVTTGDNEGSWMPQCRLNLVEEGGFYGVMNTAHRKVLPKTYDAPICWFPKSVDNSGGGQAWVESDKWGPFKGDLLHLSYGTCSLYKVMYEKVNGIPQGGVVRLPVNFSTGIMRARFNDGDGQLYVAGLRGWQTSAAQDGAFTRVRYTGADLTIPTGLKVVKDGIEITFTNALDKEEAGDVQAYAVSQWNYNYSEAYGSSDYSLAKPGEKGQDTVKIKSAKVSADGKTVKLEIPSISPVMQMRIKIDILDASDNEVFCEIFNTINVVPN
ncbi:MAG: hypothetical protein NE327_23440 [Lentisphaeraceae bacterium]|nr:hypothetical protein [Lentisphaeraceae bacterium]